MPLLFTLVAHRILKMAFVGRVVLPAAAVAFLSWSVTGTCCSLYTVDRCRLPDFHLLGVAVGGFRALRNLQGFLQRQVCLGQQMLLCCFIPESTYQSITKGLFQERPVVTVGG